MTDEKRTDEIMEKVKELSEKKGDRYAAAATIAAALSAIVLGSETDEEADKAADELIKALDDFPKETISDAIGITNVFFKDDVTIEEAADKWFEEKTK